MRPLIAFVVLSLLAPPAARADVDPVDWSYQLVSPRGRARLVQRCTGPGACRADGLDRRGRRLWSHEGALAPRYGTAIADDGRHVVHVTELLPVDGVGAAVALSFFEDGRALRSWTVKELVDRPEALPSYAGTRRWVSDWRFSKDGRSLELSFLNGEKRSYALDTGSPRT